ASVLEPVKGEGGYVVPPPKFMQEIRALCDRHNIVLIADEVQSGMGRTGKMFACEYSGVEPDVVCIAKALGGGLPLSATVARADMVNWHRGAHASTFGGNPVAIAASLKTFELLEGGLLQNSAKMGERMLNGLKEIALKYPDTVFDVRGLGLMIGVELVKNRVTNEPDA